MREKDGPPSLRMTNGYFSKLIVRVVRIKVSQGQGIEKHRRSFLERNVVLAQICLGFLRIPLIDHAFILPQYRHRRRRRVELEC